MSGTVWAAVVVTAVSASIAALAWETWRRDRAVLAAFVTGLPLSAIANEYVKTPIIMGIEDLTWPSASGAPPWVFLSLVLWVAPLVEEAVKLLPLVLPDVRSRLAAPSMPFRVGMASGFGFGLGEAWYLAWGISHTPAYASLPFLSLTGYIFERLIVTIAHGAMTSVAVSGFAGVSSPAAGYASAVALHALLNAGSLAYQAGLIGNSARNAALLVSVVVIYVVFERMRRVVI